MVGFGIGVGVVTEVGLGVGFEPAVDHRHGLRVAGQWAVRVRRSREGDRISHACVVDALDRAVQKPHLAGAQLGGLDLASGHLGRLGVRVRVKG